MSLILENQSLLNTLFSLVRKGRLAGCYLIEGDEGTGKLAVARQGAAALCCSHRNEDGSPCLVCRSCRNILSGGHVDVVELRPEESGKNISVDRVRAMLQNTHTTASEGLWRIFIVEESEGMNKAAQNALLKSIEEPRPHTVFFLLTRDRTRLLPTVRSRSVLLKTETLAPELIQKFLEQDGVLPERAKELSILAKGSLGRARALCHNEHYFAIREKLLSYFSSILEGASFTRLCLIFPPANSDRKDFSLFFAMAKSALRDLIFAHYGRKEEMSFFTSGSLLSDLSELINPERAVELFEFADDMTQAAEQNVNIFSALSSFHQAAQKLCTTL